MGIAYFEVSRDLALWICQAFVYHGRPRAFTVIKDGLPADTSLHHMDLESCGSRLLFFVEHDSFVDGQHLPCPMLSIAEDLDDA